MAVPVPSWALAAMVVDAEGTMHVDDDGDGEEGDEEEE